MVALMALAKPVKHHRPTWVTAEDAVSEAGHVERRAPVAVTILRETLEIPVWRWRPSTMALTVLSTVTQFSPGAVIENSPPPG